MGAAIWGFLFGVIGPILIKILVSLGIGFTVYTGAQLGLDSMMTWIQGQFAGLPAYALQLVGVLKIDVALSMIMSAYGAKLALQVTNGALTRVGWGRAGNVVGV